MFDKEESQWRAYNALYNTLVLQKENKKII